MKKYTKKLDEARNWLPSMVNDRSKHNALVSKVSREIGYGIGDAYAFCVSLLEDVNAHEMAQKVNDILYKDTMTW